ncbi:nucleobase:cation symporter-2 family protein [Saxibacter everestensis]|uniref:Nucleobase:cation symporter-2 family protein n=1 Tax=Saxibacter everestensis TaxID=2909229 RepID=A0ABY8QTJ2_9MICO|nr:nucleobase:cation symporter-2 family protein [Brevibacteriaceae bacterium ZFBP1038]
MRRFIFRRPKAAGASPVAPEDEKYPFWQTLAYGTQHILAMYGGVIAPPIIVGTAAGLSAGEIALLLTAGLFVSGASTMLQTLGVWKFGSRLPVVQGISFISVSTMVVIVSDQGLPTLFGAIIVAGAAAFLVAPLFGAVIRFFPPVVTGSIIIVIGISLLPIALTWIQGGVGAENFGSMSNLGLAGFTFVVIMLLSRLFQGAISRLSILLGIIIGTALAAVMGQADFSTVGDGPVFAVPGLMPFGAPEFSFGAIVSMFIVCLIIMIETATAGIITVGEIIGAKVDAKRITAGLRADMISTTVAPIFGTFPLGAFAQNVGLVALTGIRSRYAVAAGGGVMLLLGLLPIVGRVVAAIPYPVLGGAGIVLFGTVAASGIRSLATVRFDGNLNLVIVAVTVGVGIIPQLAPDFWSSAPGWLAVVLHSGITAAAVLAILLNLFFNEWSWGKRKDPSITAAGVEAAVEAQGKTN